MVKPRLFVAVLVLQSRINAQDGSPIVDHQVYLIRAPNAKSAHARALHIGEDENGTYRDRDGHAVTWEFLGVSDLDALEESQLGDGGEVFSWRTRGPGREFVTEKEQLAVFRAKAAKPARKARKE